MKTVKYIDTVVTCKVVLMMILIMLCLFVSSCKKDSFVPDASTAVTDGEVDFYVQLPGLTNVMTTYSITDQEENTIQTVDILAFKVNNKGQSNETETFAYRVDGTAITTPNSTSSGSKSFRAKLQQDTEVYYRFVLLANVRTQLNAVTIAVNENKNTLLARLRYEKSGQWNATSTTNFTAFPMWGESMQLIVNESTTQIGSIALLRSLARVDVFLSGTALSNFVITSISVINGRSNGLVGPAAENYNAASGSVDKESLPVAATFNAGPVTYTVPSPGRSFEQEIYIFESTKSSLVASQSTSTELMIAGRYNGSTAITYYRIAFLGVEGSSLPVLRNHHYNVNIAKVSGAGYPNMAIALRNVPANMEVATSTWDDSGMNVMATDGQYILALSNDHLEVGGATAQATNFTLYTDYPFGCSVQSQVNWIGVTSVRSGNRYIFTLTTQGSSNIGAASSRTGTVTITTGTGATTGRITKTITVTQRNTN